GGGGGGGEGGFFVNDGAGAGGGGGGGGGQGGQGGTGGLGGGGSFALYLETNGVGGNITDCNFASGTTGVGGAGGINGPGGAGGAGGAGGNPSCDVGNGGNGGTGGTGGAGGAGGAGDPGARATIYLNSGSPLSTSDTTFNLSGQPAITVDNLSCTGVNINYIAASSSAWDLGLSATPQVPVGDTVTTVYSLIGRKDIAFGLDTYTGFLNIADSSIAAALTPSDSIDICGVDSVLLTANAGFVTYQWQFNGVDIVGATNSTLYATTIGSYTFIGSTSCCGASDTSAPAILDIVALPVADAGTGGPVCDLDFTFSANSSLGNGAWSVVSGPGAAIFGDTISPTDSVSVSEFGTYVFQWTETNSTCSDSDTVTVNFFEQPITNAGIGGVACDSTFVLSANLSSGSGTWSQLSGSGTTAFANINSGTTITTVSAFGTYIYQWLEVNGICSDSDTVTVVYAQLPVVKAGLGGVECDLDFTFSAAPSLGIGTWTQLSGGGTSTFINANNATTDVTVSAPGTYIFRWTEVNNVCSSFADVVVAFSQPLVADAGPDITISLGNSVTLNGQGGIFYLWTPDSTLSNSSISQPVASPFESTIYALTVTDNNGCSDVDSVRVDVLEDFSFTVSNMMTPNGDGYNDTWYIDNIDFYSDCEVSVYNRYGNLLFSQRDYLNDWDGTVGGQLLPDGTYYYIITCPGTKNAFKGAITILSQQ
ncbi:MAG: gliding motility-associated C-terminal domain-containing protein, partial [Flavobacteriales bacterium]|nr:gliding motility-associated C-terminal domain-containing protein [Flavobacteriales bacterium]